jgi:hypothetical protein
LNALQFNAIAVVFILGFMPFAVAFITNAGSSSDGTYEDSISSSQIIYHPNTNEWLNNGGTNYTQQYLDSAAPGTEYLNNRTYVENGEFTSVPGLPFTQFPAYAYPGTLPMTSLYLRDTHWWATSLYVGSSGNGPFTLLLNSKFWNEVESNETIDKWRFTFADTRTAYNCASTIFENLTFEADMTWIQANRSVSFNDFQFTKSNKLEYTQWDPQHGYTDVCVVGFQIVFDLAGFESLVLDDLIQGDWFNASLILNLDNFERADDKLPFTNEALPFAGDGDFNLGVEHQAIDPVQAGFIIKTGTLFLAFATFAFAIASTPYWDPFKNTFKGMVD